MSEVDNVEANHPEPGSWGWNARFFESGQARRHKGKWMGWSDERIGISFETGYENG